jgi:2-oxoglutarate dehydrogenase E1 component
MDTNALHQMILDNMRGGVLSIDLKGRLTTFNPAAEKLLGLESEEVVGRTFAEVFLEISGSDDFVQVVLDAIYDDAVTHHQRVEFPSHEGTRRLDMTTSFLFAGDRGSQRRQRVGVVAVFDDVTEVESLREFARAMAAQRVQQLVRAYRERGHIMAKLDPLELAKPVRHPELQPEHYGIDTDELAEIYPFVWGDESVRWSLRQIIQALEATYCSAAGIQYMHIDDLEIQAWLRSRIESSSFQAPPPRERQLRILRKLVNAETFESFLQSTFRRAKRFSLEGAETLIPLLDLVIDNAAEHGATDVLLGMSHRGRLNVLANVLDVAPSRLFQRFEQLDAGNDADSDGDVRFHLGVETELETSKGHSLRVSLSFNPSHLEFVGPVVMGRARARQDILEAEGADAVLPVVIHGDAAFAGQGVVQESLNMSRLAGYGTGGTVHVILNNQIGFTTEPAQGRSTEYPSDVARMLQVPIFHVDGEQPEAVCRVIELAMEFRRTWHRDVVVDMYCYRRRGHMEQDDPSLTQPLLYQVIDSRPPVVQRYTKNLLKLGNVTTQEAEEITYHARQLLEDELEQASAPSPIVADAQPSLARPSSVPSAVDTAKLRSLLHRLSSVPEGFTPHSKIKALLRRRQAMADEKQAVDWGTGEALAYATLLSEGYRVRLSGQDSERGTFGHRYAVLHDVATGTQFTPLGNLDSKQAPVAVLNSPLTETAVMAFEFGYSTEAGGGLVVWEAQFGDFANVAQVVIDQFLVSSQAKWGQSSGLVLLLPHGLEGQGPEHSSARPERFLQLCADGNIEVVHLLTASQVFHRLRQQALSPVRRPLVAFTPKQLLHGAFASCSLEELSQGSFRAVVVDANGPDAQRLLLCSGQIAAVLTLEREKRKQQAAIIRLDRLYPLPVNELRAALGEYPPELSLIWVQEEPENMGAWRWLRPQLEAVASNRQIRCVARPERASPASGSVAVHQREQAQLLDQSFE